MTTNIEINSLLRDDSVFIGCFPLNQLPNIEDCYPRSIIIYTHPSEGGGEHWVAIVTTIEQCFYFDSFGCGIIEMNI